MIRRFLPVVALSACTPSDSPTDAALPAAWQDCGTVLAAGEPGEWDHLLWGGFASALLIRDGRFLLYYQGSDGYDEVGATVTRRAVGVAISTDGLRFTKHHSNPVLRFSPRSNAEEGAVSTAFLPAHDDTLIVYYGANRWVGGHEVTADARIGRSLDGLLFTDHGVLLDHADPGLWGSGDEIFPVAAHRYRERTLVYYIPNGTAEGGRLGVWWSDSGAARPHSAAVRGQRRAPVRAWGPASIVAAAADTFVLFTSNVRADAGVLQARVVTAGAPAAVLRTARHYGLDGRVPLSVARTDAGVWYLVYRSPDHLSLGMMMSPGCPATEPTQQS